MCVLILPNTKCYFSVAKTVRPENGLLVFCWRSHNLFENMEIVKISSTPPSQQKQRQTLGSVQFFQCEAKKLGISRRLRLFHVFIFHVGSFFIFMFFQFLAVSIFFILTPCVTQHLLSITANFASTSVYKFSDNENVPFRQ